MCWSWSTNDASAARKKVDKKKRLHSPAHKFARQYPKPFRTLPLKVRLALLSGKTRVFIKYRKNEVGKKMVVTRTEIVIRKPPKMAYKGMADFKNTHLFMPRMYYSKLIKKLKKNTYHVLRKLKVAWVKIPMNVEIRLKPHRRYEFSLMRHLKNGVRDSEGAMTFEPILKGKYTFVTYRLYSDSGRWVPGFIKNPLLKRDLPNVLKALRKRVESNFKWKKKK